MFTPFRCFFLVLLFIAPHSLFAQAVSPGEHPYFKALVGKWVGDGTLKDRAGDEKAIHEEWTGAVTEGATFTVSGKRRLGDESHDFSWIFSLNASSGIWQCEYQHTGMDMPMWFEVSLSDTRAEMRTPLGDPGSELLITNTIEAGGIAGTVAHRDANGQEFIGGTVKHRRAG